MRTKILLWFFIVSLFSVTGASAQGVNDNVCHISNNRIYFRLDKRWSQQERKEFGEAFSLDSLLIEKAFSATTPLMYDSLTWEVNRLDNNHIEISKPIDTDWTPNLSNDVLLRDDIQVPIPVIVFTGFMNTSNKFGINDFNDPSVFSYQNDTATFLLKGHDRAERVYLSGTFNNWSTMQQPMQKTTEGWLTSIPLKPGRYLYKFIIDGKWRPDPGNRLYEYDGHSGYNSIVFCYNHSFELNGYEKAKKVFVAGSFNNWRPRQIRMNPTAGGAWVLPVYLDMGTHFYKYVVDGKWITDPDNKNLRLDADGNANSFFGIGDTIIFRLKGYESANTVILSGNFNNWSWNELTMNKVPGGWELPYVLGPGNYEYKFIVDGKWITDPENPYTIGSGDFTNSCFTFKPNVTFTLPHFENAKSVIVTGTFNNWNIKAYEMERVNGVWTYSMYLNPGKYTYKFIVDGSWLIDPGNPTWEENSFGTGNSVIWVGQ